MKRLLTSFLLVPLIVHAADDIEISSQQLTSMGVRLEKIVAANAQTSNRFPGEVVVPVSQERVVSSPQPGLVDSVSVAAGQTVKRGQVLAHISSPDLVSLQRDYLQAQTQLRLAGNLLERDRGLFNDGIIAERRMLTTQSNYDELEITLAQRRQALKLSGLGDESIRRMEKNGGLSSGIALAAPMDGVVLEQMVTAGQRVDANAPIYRIARLKPLWLEIHAPLNILSTVQEGMRLVVPDYGAEGKVISIIRSVNKADQTVHVRAEISYGAEKLSPGQFVEASLVVGNTPDQFAIPKKAVVRSGSKSYIFVQTAKGFRAVPVTLASEQAETAVISGKFTGNEKVAVSGTAAIKAVWFGIGGE